MCGNEVIFSRLRDLKTAKNNFVVFLKMQNLKREINLKWKPYIISMIVCFLMSLVGLILSAATWDTPRQKAQANIDRDFQQFLDSELNLVNMTEITDDPAKNSTGAGLPIGGPPKGGSPVGNSPEGGQPKGGSPPRPQQPPPPPPPAPQPDAFSRTWFGECLRVHNNYRSQLENIRDGSPVRGFSWSNDLARDAFSWARHLADRNSGLKHSTSFGHGENLYSGTNGPKNCEPAISAFFNEYPLYHNEKIGEGNFMGYGHFTQVNCAFKHSVSLAIFSKAWLCLCGQSKYEIHRLPL